MGNAQTADLAATRANSLIEGSFRTPTSRISPEKRAPCQKRPCRTARMDADISGLISRKRVWANLDIHDFPGVISWKKFNRGNLPDILNFYRPASALSRTCGSHTVSDARG
jgi:hypothetical protein